MSEPLKVSISPKAMRTLWWISPNGGQRKPANNSPHPNPHSIIATINWKFFFMISLSFSPRGPHEIRDLVGRAEALSALTTTVGQCTKLPNARTNMHNATAVKSWKFFFIVLSFNSHGLHGFLRISFFYSLLYPHSSDLQILSQFVTQSNSEAVTENLHTHFSGWTIAVRKSIWNRCYSQS